MTTNLRGQQVDLLVIQLCCIVFVLLMVGLRLHLRIILNKPHAWDDKLMYISAVLYIIHTILALRGIIEGGLGQRISEFDRHQIVIAFQTWYFGELIYALVSISVRLSVGIFLLKLSDRTKYRQRYKNLFWVSLSIVVCVATIFFFASLFQCSPPQYYWEQFENPESDGSCRNDIVPTAAIVLSVVAAISDWLLAVLSIAILWKTSIPWQSKLKIGVLISLGFSAGAFMIVRITYINSLEITETFIEETLEVAVWTILEPALGICAGCLLTLVPLAKKWKRPSSQSNTDSILTNPQTYFVSCTAPRTDSQMAGDHIYVVEDVDISRSKTWLQGLD